MINSQIADVERIIQSNRFDEQIESARSIIRQYLHSVTDGTAPNATIGDLVAAIADAAHRHQQEAVYLLRWASVQNLLPESNSNNNIHRNLVAIAERTLPAIRNYLTLDEKKQTFQKIDALIGIHATVEQLLAPLQIPRSEIGDVLASRQPVLAALNHSVVRAYCTPFALAPARAHIDNLFRRFSNLNLERESLLLEIDEARLAVDRGIQFADDNYSFLSNNYLRPFFTAGNSALDRFILSARGRLESTISHRLPPNDTLQKRYPLRSAEREVSLQIPLRNDGPSTAVNVRADIAAGSDSVVLDRDSIALGNLSVGDFSLVVKLMTLHPVEELPLMIDVSWRDAGGTEKKTLSFTVTARSQAGTVDWTALDYARPYTTEVAKGLAFVGRDELVQTLANKILRTPMEPFYITGQKRVGKTSLAWATAEFAKNHEKGSSIQICYCLWGEIAHAEPNDSVKALGRAIANSITARLPIGRQFPGTLNFDGSLADLVALARHTGTVAPNSKYVIIIDEFDEIHQELYLQGNLAETFFANLRALAALENICLVLVGGENMPYIMDRQGQKLNRFVRIGLDYFSRDREWSDFVQLVQKPTESALNWQDEAISEIFNATNGNPYFAKLVCAETFSTAVKERDADITGDEIVRAIIRQVSQSGANSFAHLWQDGIFKAAQDREPDILRRKRLLATLSRVLRNDQLLNLENIVAASKQSSLNSAEVLPTLNDFARRNILREKDGVYEFVLPIFRLWLNEVGTAEFASDAIGEELARSVQAAEDAAYVKPSEIEELVQKWPLYQGRRVTGESVRAWLNQVENNRHRRLLFTLLANTVFFDEQKIRQSLKTAHGIIRPSLPQFIQKRRSQRRADLVVTYIDGEGKSGQYYASKYAEENGISTQSIISPADFENKLNQYQAKHGRIAAIVIIDDIVATGSSLARNLLNFCDTNRAILETTAVPITAVALVSTPVGEQQIRQTLQGIEGLDLDFRVCDFLPPNAFAFGEESAIWATMEDRDEARAICEDIGARIYFDNPLGYGGHALLVVFPDTCPNNTLPILHSSAPNGERTGWKPLFQRLVN